MIQWCILQDESDLRPDRFLRARYPEVARDQALAYLKKGLFQMNGQKARLATRLKTGDVLELHLDPKELGVPKDANLDVIALSSDAVVVHKEAGMAMHTGTGVQKESETLKGAIDALFPATDLPEHRPHHGRPFKGPSFLGRLDRQTSGLVIAALTWNGLKDLEPAWTEGNIEKAYLLLAHGRTPEQKFIDVPLVSLKDRHKGKGRVEDARSQLHTLACAKDGRVSLVLVFLHTGRTHQIRRHLKAIGHPLLGDPRYGHKKKDLKLLNSGIDPRGLQLHCFRYLLPEPLAGLPQLLKAPLPKRMRAVMHEAGMDVECLALADHLHKLPFPTVPS